MFCRFYGPQMGPEVYAMRRTFCESETYHPRGSRRFESRKVRHAIRLMLSKGGPL